MHFKCKVWRENNQTPSAYTTPGKGTTKAKTIAFFILYILGQLFELYHHINQFQLSDVITLR